MFEMLKVFIRTKQNLAKNEYEISGSKEEYVAIDKICDEMIAFIEEIQKECSNAAKDPYDPQVLDRILPGLNKACQEGRIMVFDEGAKTLHEVNSACNNNGHIQYNINSTGD